MLFVHLSTSWQFRKLPVCRSTCLAELKQYFSGLGQLIPAIIRTLSASNFERKFPEAEDRFLKSNLSVFSFIQALVFFSLHQTNNNWVRKACAGRTTTNQKSIVIESRSDVQWELPKQSASSAIAWFFCKKKKTRWPVSSHYSSIMRVCMHPSGLTWKFYPLTSLFVRHSSHAG